MQKNEIFERIWLRMMVMPMDVYVARQPILDRKGEAAAFELLYRSSSSANWATPLDNPDDATVDVLVNALLHVGLERISDGKPCFVNFTQSLLLRRLPHQLPPDNIVVELLEDIEPDPPVIDACFDWTTSRSRTLIIRCWSWPITSKSTFGRRRRQNGR